LSLLCEQIEKNEEYKETRKAGGEEKKMYKAGLTTVAAQGAS